MSNKIIEVVGRVRKAFWEECDQAVYLILNPWQGLDGKTKEYDMVIVCNASSSTKKNFLSKPKNIVRAKIATIKHWPREQFKGQLVELLRAEKHDFVPVKSSP